MASNTDDNPCITPVISARHLVKTFGHGDATVRAVDEVDLDIFPGELVLVMGPSGSGKTTLLSMLGGLLRPTSGAIKIADESVTELGERRLSDLRAQKIGFIFQSFNLLEALTVEENILLPASLLPGGTRRARERALMLMDAVELNHRRHAHPATLSGGEQQRVAIARALLNEPRVILADEPTGNLDSHLGQEVMMMLYDVARDENRAVLIVTHDSRIEQVADRLLWLEDGRLRDRKTEHHEWVKCPMCAMRVDAWTATVRIEQDDIEYVFCSRRCRTQFLAGTRC